MISIRSTLLLALLLLHNHTALAACKREDFALQTPKMDNTSAVYQIRAKFVKRRSLTPDEGVAFLMDAANGVLVTAAHSVIGKVPSASCSEHSVSRWEELEAVWAKLPEGDFPLEVIVADPCTDLALLKFIGERPDLATGEELRLAYREYLESASSYENGHIVQVNQELLEDRYSLRQIRAEIRGEDPGINADSGHNAQLCDARDGKFKGRCYVVKSDRALERGESGTPVIDTSGRAFAVVVRRLGNNDGLAVPTWHVWDLLRRKDTELPLVSSAQLAGALSTALREADDIDKAKAALNELSPLELALALDHLSADDTKVDLSADLLECPLRYAANVNLLPQHVLDGLYLKSRIRTVQVEEVLQERAAIRRVGQIEFAAAKNSQASKNERVGHLRIALRAFQNAIPARIAAAERPEDLIFSLAGPSFTGEAAFLPQYLLLEPSDWKARAENESWLTQDIAPDDPEMEKIIKSVANEFGVEIGETPVLSRSALRRDTILAAILREYADTALMLSSLSGRAEAISYDRLAAGAAYWSVRVESDVAGLAQSHRTYGDALSRLNRDSDAAIAHARAIEAGSGVLSDATKARFLARFAETCAVADVCGTVDGLEATAAQFAGATISPDLTGFFATATRAGVIGALP